MKKYVLFLVCIIFISKSYAQDIIVKKNGEEIKSKIQEIGATDIKYKKFDNLNGPAYSISRTDVYMLRFENGTKEVINEVSKSNPSIISQEKQAVKSPDNRKPMNRFYVKFGGGYCFSLAPTSADDQESIGNGTISHSILNESLASGGCFGGTFGILFNKYFGFELPLWYLIGKQNDSYSHYGYLSYYEISDAETLYIAQDEDLFYARSLMLRPSFTISPGLSIVNPYMTFGVIIGFSKVTQELNRQYYDNSTGGLGNTFDMTEEFQNGKTIGGFATFGLSFIAGKHFSIFTEFSFSNAVYIPKKMVLTKATYNGVDRIAELSESLRETDFVTSYSTDYSGDQSSSSPTKALQERFNFSNFGFNAGISFSF